MNHRSLVVVRKGYRNRDIKMQICWVRGIRYVGYSCLELTGSTGMEKIDYTESLVCGTHLIKSWMWQVQLSSVAHRVWLFVTPWTEAHQASLSITNSQSLWKRRSIVSAMPSNHLILCRSLLLPPSVFPSIRVFSNESVLCIRWPKYWSFSYSFSIRPFNTARVGPNKSCNRVNIC